MLAVTAYPIGYAVSLSLQRYNLAQPDDTEFVGLENYVTVLTDRYWWTAFVVTAGDHRRVGRDRVRARHGAGTGDAPDDLRQGRCAHRDPDSVRHRHRRGVLQLVLRMDAGHGVSGATCCRGQRARSPNSFRRWPSWCSPRCGRRRRSWRCCCSPDWRWCHQDLLNAAQIDGAGSWKRLIKVILPLDQPAILVALLFRTLDAFRIFDNIYVLTGGANDTGSVSNPGLRQPVQGIQRVSGRRSAALIFFSVAIIAFIYIKIFGASAPGSDAEERRSR